MPSGAPVTESDSYKLLYAMISQIHMPKLDWDLIGAQLGIKPRTARQRWGNIQKKQMGRVISGAGKKGAAGVKKIPAMVRKRKVEDLESDDGESEDGEENDEEGGESGGEVKERGLAGKEAKREEESEKDRYQSQEVHSQDRGEDVEDSDEIFEMAKEEQQDVGGEDDYAVLEYGQYYGGYPVAGA
jgi:hypothetical protein